VYHNIINTRKQFDYIAVSHTLVYEYITIPPKHCFSCIFSVINTIRSEKDGVQNVLLVSYEELNVMKNKVKSRMHKIAQRL